MNFCCYGREMGAISCHIYDVYKRKCMSSVSVVIPLVKKVSSHSSHTSAYVMSNICVIPLIFFPAGQLSGFVLQANICNRSHSSPLQKELHVFLHMLLWLSLNCLDSEVKKKIQLGVMKGDNL